MELVILRAFIGQGHKTRKYNMNILRIQEVRHARSYTLIHGDGNNYQLGTLCYTLIHVDGNNYQLGTLFLFVEELDQRIQN